MAEDARPLLLVADRYSTAVDWCVENGVERGQVKIVTRCQQLRGLNPDDYEVIKACRPDSPREFSRLLATLEERWRGSAL